MKITHLLWALVALGLAIFGIKYSLDQQKVLNMLVATHGGHDQAETGGGLRQLRKDLTSEASEMAKLRADAVSASDKQRLLMRDARNNKEESAAILEGKKSDLADAQAKLAEETARVDQMKLNIQAAMDSLKAGLGDSVPDVAPDAEIKDFVFAISTYVEKTSAEIKTMEAQLEEQQTLVAAATDRVAKATVELANVEQIKADFVADYERNDDMFIVRGVNPRWNIVVFEAPTSSALIPGDQIPLIVKRGDAAIAELRIVSVNGNSVVAEYDPEKVPAGVQIVIGDQVIRKKPTRE